MGLLLWYCCVIALLCCLVSGSFPGHLVSLGHLICWSVSGVWDEVLGGGGGMLVINMSNPITFELGLS